MGVYEKYRAMEIMSSFDKKKALLNGYKWVWLLGYPSILIFELIMFVFSPEALVELQRWEFWGIILVIPAIACSFMMLVGYESVKGLKLDDIGKFLTSFILAAGSGLLSATLIGGWLYYFTYFWWYDSFSIFRLIIGAALGSSSPFFGFVLGWVRRMERIDDLKTQIGLVLALLLICLVLSIIVSIIF
ncbi:MAG: hypothetical protein GF329_09620 [Candidatus Lokiarchaeota archaeon]|nr:hypothetical protein [Candidatus Lokiarchaeota archaeon]